LKRNLSGRLAALATISVLALGVLIGLATGPASAATPNLGNPSCPGSTFCMWQNQNYGANGGAAYFYAFSAHTPNQWFSVGSGANDQASSFFANRLWTTAFAKNFNSNPTTGQWACVLGGDQVTNLGDFLWNDGTKMNDSISALYFWTSSGDGGCPQVF
jgi:hypothetical protein